MLLNLNPKPLTLNLTFIRGQGSQYVKMLAEVDDVLSVSNFGLVGLGLGVFGLGTSRVRVEGFRPLGFRVLPIVFIVGSCWSYRLRS